MARKKFKYESSYLDGLFDHPALTVNRIVRIIRKEFPSCRALAVADGVSGLSLIVPVALRLELPFCVVRSKKSHSHYKIEGHTNIRRYVYIDDFIDSGKTFINVYNALRQRNGARPVGAVLYQSSDSRSKFEYDMERQTLRYDAFDTKMKLKVAKMY